MGRALSARLLQIGHTVIAADTDLAAAPDGVAGVVGDLGDPSVRRQMLMGGCDAVVHLATVPGGAAEADPAASRRINCDATYDLIRDTAAFSPGARFVFASSIAVFGDPPLEGVDDETPLTPRMIYAGHKAMMEQAISLYSRRGSIDGVTVRLPGIVARPAGSAGMKSAFLSELFHALSANRPFTCPVSEDGTVWVQSIDRCVDNVINALMLDSAMLPPSRAVTLPATWVSIGDLVAEITRQCHASISPAYEPDIELEKAFASLPRLSSRQAQAAGFRDDGDLQALVGRVLRRGEALAKG